MNPESLLRRMCARHGVPLASGARLLPMVERALQAPTDVRRRLLKLVEANLAYRAKAPEKEAAAEPQESLDSEVLMAVARILHGWKPKRLLDLEDEPST